MSLIFAQSILFSLWAVLILRLFKRAQQLQQAVAMKKRKPHAPRPAVPMAVRAPSLRP